jgi:HAD superfamily hydrolase (TIGR01459 family)
MASYLDELPGKYRLILCDVWGVIHDGVALYPGAADRLHQWRGEGRTVVLLTNAPRTAEAVEAQLQRIGLAPDAWDHVATSGEAGIAALLAIGAPVGFLGTRSDRAILEGKSVPIAGDDSFRHLACTGLDDARTKVEDYRADLEALADRDVIMHCLNPDRVVVRGGVTEACAGALADVYAGLGGQVEWYGKPYPTVYRYVLGLAGNPPADEVLAVGDGLQTDVLGAARMGFDTVFVSGGIHAGEPFPDNYAAQYGLGDWAPVAVVEGLD